MPKVKKIQHHLLLISICGIALCASTACNQGGQSTSAGRIEAGNITILDTRTDLTDRARAKQNVEDILISSPDVDCLVGLWSYNGPAILSAVKDADKAGKMPVVCFDEEEDTLQGIADGHIYGTVVQQPYEFGYQSVKMLSALARGDRSMIPENKILDIPVIVIKKDNVIEFRDKLLKLVAGETSPTDAPPAQSPVAEKAHIAFITNNPSDFWRIAYAGIVRAEAEFNAKCEFLMPDDGTAATQQRMVENMISLGVSGMAISPNDPINQIGLLNDACEKMNVICHDSDAPQSNRMCYVGTNNYIAGREAGKLIKEILPEGGEIVIFVGRLDAQNAKERHQGIVDELKGNPVP